MGEFLNLVNKRLQLKTLPSLCARVGRQPPVHYAPGQLNCSDRLDQSWQLPPPGQVGRCLKLSEHQGSFFKNIG